MLTTSLILSKVPFSMAIVSKLASLEDFITCPNKYKSSTEESVLGYEEKKKDE